MTSLVLYPSTTFAALPTSTTIDAFRVDLSHTYTQFQSVLAPTAVTTSFLLAAGLALWWAAFVADWAAFRLWVPFESVVPAGTVFVFASLFAAKQHRVDSTALFVGAVLAYLLVHRVARQQVHTGWMANDARRGATSLLAIGGIFVVATVATAALAGPRLPQAGADALVTWRGEGGSSREAISPFVEIRKRLIDQSLTELFTVRSNQRSYWRLTSLDQFDGNAWSSNGSYDKATGTLPGNIGSTVTTAVATQTFSIAQLGTIWVPAAFEPKSIDAGSTPVRYESDTSTLIVGTDVASADRLTYTVQSVLPVFDPAQLEAAPADVPGDVNDTYLQLPAGFSDKARSLAAQVTAGDQTVYDKALALQNYFRDNFQYSLEVPADVQGESTSAIDAFLDSKAGYCEQFAGTYAAMARSLGIPARVAVGFTPGEQDPAQPDLYHVRGEHAHAWPEVYIGGQGWVLFEPTPTRGAPNAQQYTHVPEQQSTGGGQSATTAAPTSPVTSPTTVPGGSTPATPLRDLGTTGTATTSTGSTVAHRVSVWFPRVLTGLVVGAIGAAGILVLADGGAPTTTPTAGPRPA